MILAFAELFAYYCEVLPPIIFSGNKTATELVGDFMDQMLDHNGTYDYRTVIRTNDTEQSDLQ